MLGDTAHFLANQLKILSTIAADPKHGHLLPHLHIVLVSDAKIDIVNTVLQPAGISLKQVGATLADGALHNYNETIIVAMTNGLTPTNLKVHMVLGGNPLVGTYTIAMHMAFDFVNSNVRTLILVGRYSTYAGYTWASYLIFIILLTVSFFFHATSLHRTPLPRCCRHPDVHSTEKSNPTESRPHSD